MTTRFIEHPHSVEQFHELNRRAWNEAAFQYGLELESAIEFIRSGKESLWPIEKEILGRLDDCKRAIHLQCASGYDTLCLWNYGAREVVGVDISERHIENAKRLSAAVGAPATWYCCDVLKVDHALDGTADLVYTGQGALPWIFDIKAWGAVVARLLKPGGRVFVYEGHPVEWLFDPTQPGWIISQYSYFDGIEVSKVWPAEYLTKFEHAKEDLAPQYSRAWPLSEIIMALLNAGLQLELIREHPERYWNSFPKVPEALQGQVPRTFSLVARRPGAR